MTLLLERTSYATNSKRPLWEEVGVKLTEPVKTPWEALILAGANWSVYKAKLGASLVDPNTNTSYYFEDSRRYGVFRNDNNQYLGCVGESFELVQNAAGFNHFTPFLSNGYAFLESAGTLRKGEIVWVIAQMCHDNMQEVVDGDTVEQRLLLTLCHNTNHAPKVILINTRSEGQTVLAAAHKLKPFKLRQTKSIGSQLTRVQHQVAYAKACFDKDVELYKLLASKQITSSDVDSVLTHLFANQLAKTRTLADGTTEFRWTLKTLYASRSILETLDKNASLQADNVRGTAWALYNAIGHYYTYTSIDTRRAKSLSKVEAQLEALWFTKPDDMMSTALTLLLNL